jgi:hypothetical protein
MSEASKKTTDGSLVVDIIGYAEPNNGRVLAKVNVLHNDININEKLFTHNWNFINHRTDKWQLEGFGYAYIPVEGSAKLIHLNTLNIHTLSYKGISTISFKGNSFGFNKLLEVYDDAIQITDLQTLNVRILKYKGVERVEWATFVSENEIEVKLIIFSRSGNHKRSTEVRSI